MDTERSKLAEHIAQTGHKINWKATERRAPYGDNTKKRKIMEPIDMLGENNLINRIVKERGVSANFSHCLSKLGQSKNTAVQQKGYVLIKGHSLTTQKEIARKKAVGKSRKSSKDVLSQLGSQGTRATDKQSHHRKSALLPKCTRNPLEMPHASRDRRPQLA
ncbi:unnamed protein product [Protopolystoma xenopodis]|uniref:Uncharacterized protein n=1 Tax=Protopolystoma xenopodis TaxID=117903 RepID=A0A448WVV3_9PLAT|nr:unnamed protein product [Protopolystoma xenopodis]